MTIFDDLEAEQDRLQGILDGLDEAAWGSDRITRPEGLDKLAL
jgi:hypothetical protein